MSYLKDWPRDLYKVREALESKKCGDCGVSPGSRHKSGCDVERCSACGGQWIACGCLGHDQDFSRWTGLWPGEAEAKLLGIDLNQFASLGLAQIFFAKPKSRAAGQSSAHEKQPRRDCDLSVGDIQCPSLIGHRHSNSVLNCRFIKGHFGTHKTSHTNGEEWKDGDPFSGHSRREVMLTIQLADAQDDCAELAEVVLDSMDDDECGAVILAHALKEKFSKKGG